MIIIIVSQRPSMDQVVSWIDVDTLLLLFSMMILVAVIAETGIFDYLAVYAYKVKKKVLRQFKIIFLKKC